LWFSSCELQIEKEIDKGSSSIVHKATYKEKTVAVKQAMQIEGVELDMNEFRREVWLMRYVIKGTLGSSFHFLIIPFSLSLLSSGVSHANIVHLVGFCTAPACIVEEYLSGLC